MSLAFGTRFTFRMHEKPQRQGLDVPTQETVMFGAKGKSILRGEQTAGKLVFKVAQDGFATQTIANHFVDSVIAEKGHVDTLTITGRATVTAVLTDAVEERVILGGGTTTGWHARLSLTFEEIAT